jgi:1-deoxy-D-xylulose-5-phosphate reductoisomerase
LIGSPLPIVVLGSTGSIGRQTLEIAFAFKEKVRVVGLACGTNMEQMAKDALAFQPEVISVLAEAQRKDLISRLQGKFSPLPEILIGPDGLTKIAQFSSSKLIVSGISGAIGLAPTWAALNSGKRVALANKESLVLFGDKIMPRFKDLIIPVDSEHSAIFQALGLSLDGSGLRRIILTASGGPFLGRSLEELRGVTIAEALAHPSWHMGPKITIESATLLNKGLEVIEAHHLFGVPYEKIDILIHPQSIIHSLVEYPDGSLIAQLGVPDMRVPIALALSYPHRWPLLDRNIDSFAPLSFERAFTFAKPDRGAFKCLPLAEAAGTEGASAPLILNAAGETAVEAFLQGAISFLGIGDLVEETLNRAQRQNIETVEDALELDKKVRELAKSLVG